MAELLLRAHWLNPTLTELQAIPIQSFLFLSENSQADLKIAGRSVAKPYRLNLSLTASLWVCMYLQLTYQIVKKIVRVTDNNYCKSVKLICAKVSIDSHK